MNKKCLVLIFLLGTVKIEAMSTEGFIAIAICGIATTGCFCSSFFSKQFYQCASCLVGTCRQCTKHTPCKKKQKTPITIERQPQIAEYQPQQNSMTLLNKVKDDSNDSDDSVNSNSTVIIHSDEND